MESFNHLIMEHDAIEQSVALLMQDMLEAKPHALLHQHLSALAVQVEQHLKAEDAVLIGLQQGQLDRPWLAAWKSAADELALLRSDWLGFIHNWTADRIAARTAEFCTAGAAILERLSERVRFETDVFYAAALQSGAIRLR
ncbi:hypothetical protein ACMGDM_20195 [Sphingomonas sp. DT-51]|uniref:hypothetical protein n=1 Tax=Sphingomonas sp. DT-51 TaxID=3396165 RepID=UPI003F1BF691